MSNFSSRTYLYSLKSQSLTFYLHSLYGISTSLNISVFALHSSNLNNPRICIRRKKQVLHPGRSGKRTPTTFPSRKKIAGKTCRSVFIESLQLYKPRLSQDIPEHAGPEVFPGMRYRHESRLRTMFVVMMASPDSDEYPSVREHSVNRFLRAGNRTHRPFVWREDNTCKNTCQSFPRRTRTVCF